MSTVFKRVELLTNLAIITVAIILSVVLVKRFLLSNRTEPPRPVQELSSGDKVPLTEVDWAGNRRTLVMVLQKGCHFCSESAPFYQRLVKETAGRTDLKLVALLPQQVADAKQYLDQIGVAIADVRQVSPNQINVHGTPTLILVNDSGVVTDVWAGKLPSETESEVLKKL